MVQATTTSWVAPAVAVPGVLAGLRRSLKIPSPSSWAIPVSTSHGSAWPAGNVGPIADSTPTPSIVVSPVAATKPAGTKFGSPVPTSTTSSRGIASNETSRAPQAWALTAPPRIRRRSDQPPTGDQVAAPSSVYQTPPWAVAAYARSPVASTAMSRIRPAHPRAVDSLAAPYDRGADGNPATGRIDG